ncbi:hypothetical protein ACJX0J_033267, partial [Zea mays]
VKRSLSQFTPAQWDKDQWHPFMGPLRFIHPNHPRVQLLLARQVSPRAKPVKKVGAFCWLSLAICIVELLICMKFGH